MRTNMAGKKEQWFLIKSKDEAARPEEEYDILEEQPDSEATREERNIDRSPRGGHP